MSKIMSHPVIIDEENYIVSGATLNRGDKIFHERCTPPPSGLIDASADILIFSLTCTKIVKGDREEGGI